MYTYILNAKGLWSVGKMKNGKWIEVAEYSAATLAEAKAKELNGPDPRLERFTMAAMQGFLASWAGSDNNPAPATVAKKSLEYALATLAALDQELEKSL